MGNHCRLTQAVRLGVGAFVVGTVLMATGGIASATTASISVSSASAPAGSQIAMTGSGWAPYDSIQIRLSSSSGLYLCTVYADSTGSVASQACTVPTSAVYGSYGIFADDEATTPITASTPFTVTPGVQLYVGTSSTVAPNANVGESIGVVGYGFAASTAVTAAFNGTAVTLTPSPTTGTAGNFAVATFTVPSVSPGDYPVTVSDGTHTGTTTLEVYTATLTAPTSEPSGSQLPIGGSGWPALDSIQIRYYQGSSNAYTCTVYSDVNQTIQIQTCTVPTSLSDGAYTLTASDGDVTASLPVTVTPTVTFSNSGTGETDYVAVGQTVYVSGTGFAGGSSITATFNHKPLALSPAPVTNSSGAFSASTFVVPKETKAGFYAVKVSDGAADNVAVNLLVYVATLVSPASAPAGTLYSVSGTGYPGYDSLQLRLYQGSASSYICTVYTNEAGKLIGQDCTLPADLPAGIYTLTLSDGNLSVSHPFTMAPNVVMIGASGGSTPTANSAVGQSVSLDGYGFSPGASLKATLNGAKVTLLPAVTVSSNGEFTGSAFTVPTLTPGRYPLVIKDTAGKEATVTLRVFAATITAPASGASGKLIPLTGAGWPHNDSMQIRLYQGGGNSYVCTINSDASGNIEPSDCTVPSGLAAGSYTLTASDGSVGVNLAGGFAITPSLALVNSSNQTVVTAAPGAVLTLSGSGFAAGGTVTSVKVGTAAVTTTPSSPAINAGGGFSGVTFVVPSVAAGTYKVTVSDSHSPADTGTIQFAVS
jgi:hypothetical protein